MLYKSSEEYQQLCDIFFDPKAEKYWAMAQQECAHLSQDADIFCRLDDVPDSLRNMLTPEQTLALFNAWCTEQGINARALAWVMIACLQARVYKKIGVYLQGASNSGKTYWTSTLFHPLSKLVGKMTTGGRFCLQDCGKKRIIVGEEIGIAVDNVDRLKELMSGEVTTFERKMKAPGTCKANLILLNSNNLPFANVSHEKSALENRMFLFRNLRRSKILPTALKGMEATRPNPKFLRLVEPPTDQELQDVVAGVYPRNSQVVDNLGLVPEFNGDWETWAEELSQNRKVVETWMAAPDYLVEPTLAIVSPYNPSPDLVTPDDVIPPTPQPISVISSTASPFPQAQPVEEDLSYFFPSLEATPSPTVWIQPDAPPKVMDLGYEAFCAYSPEAISSQTTPFDQVVDENPWKKYDARWPGASEWVLKNGPPSAYHQLRHSKEKGFHWIETLAEMSERNFAAARFVMDYPKPAKRAKLICRENGKWQWRCPAQDESMFRLAAPKTCPVPYLEVRTAPFEENLEPAPLDAWCTKDFYLDGAGFFVHRDCDKQKGTTIKYILLKNGVWDIVTKTKVPTINRGGAAVTSLTVDAAQFLNFFPSDDVPDACAPKMLPVWLPRSFITTERDWTEDDQDTLADLFYLIVGYTTPFKAQIYNIGPGPIHKWTDVSDCYPDCVNELEEEAQSCAKKIVEGADELDMVDGDQTKKRSDKVVKFLKVFIEAAATAVTMIITVLNIWDEIF